MSSFSVVPIVTLARGYRVQSKSDPSTHHIVDLSRARCTCIWAQIHQGKDKPCEHMERAVEFEQEQHRLQEEMPLFVERLKREAEERRARAGQKKAA